MILVVLVVGGGGGGGGVDIVCGFDEVKGVSGS